MYDLIIFNCLYFSKLIINIVCVDFLRHLLNIASIDKRLVLNHRHSEFVVESVWKELLIDLEFPMLQPQGSNILLPQGFHCLQHWESQIY